jgi:sec-independent protein translocase protein TatC
MRLKSDDDLFQESTMTFGEHLEELRTRLFKALFGLIIGFVLGLFFAKPVVHFIEGPIKSALESHYTKAAQTEVKEQLKELQEAGLPLPGTPDQLAKLVNEHNLLPEQVYVQPGELLQQLPRILGRRQAARARVEAALEGARPLLDRLRLPASDPRNKLSTAEQARLADAIEQVDPVSLPERDVERELTRDDLDEIARTIRKGKSASDEDLALLAEAMELEQTKAQDDLARLREAIDLAKRTRPPLLGTSEELHRDDLAPIYLWKPIEDDRRFQIQTLNAHEAFAIYIKAALLVGVLGSSWWIFIQIWLFVAAGLYRHERKFVYIFLPFSLGLFLAGASVAFFFVFKPVLDFLFFFNQMLNLDPNPRISEWLSFVLILPLGFGIAFQLPLVMLFLERIGVFTVGAYLSRWRIAILVIFVLAMFLTPADPQSMLLMAVPLTALYFGGVLLCHLFPRRRSPYDEEEEAKEEEQPPGE